jgi:hypothetical protein
VASAVDATICFAAGSTTYSFCVVRSVTKEKAAAFGDGGGALVVPSEMQRLHAEAADGRHRARGGIDEIEIAAASTRHEHAVPRRELQIVEADAGPTVRQRDHRRARRRRLSTSAERQHDQHRPSCAVSHGDTSVSTDVAKSMTRH